MTLSNITFSSQNSQLQAGLIFSALFRVAMSEENQAIGRNCFQDFCLTSYSLTYNSKVVSEDIKLLGRFNALLFFPV